MDGERGSLVVDNRCHTYFFNIDNINISFIYLSATTKLWVVLAFQRSKNVFVIVFKFLLHISTFSCGTDEENQADFPFEIKFLAISLYLNWNILQWKSL